MENFFIIDGNSLINRAFYALPLLTNSQGEYSNAVYGFCNILSKLITENKVDNLIVTFDLKAKTFRHELYADYKGTRKGMPDELAKQMPILKNMLKLMNIKILEKEGFEADDLIGTLSKRFNTKNYIITGDRDSLQLISENTEVWLTKKGISEIEKINEVVLKEKYGLKPCQIVDLKALMGDSSDNIPGVKGIGEKTAISLLNTYDNVENLYENIEDIKGKLQEKLVQGKDICYLSKILATIKTDVDINLSLNETKFKFPFDLSVIDFFKHYEFKSLLNKPELFESAIEVEEKNSSNKKFVTNSVELNNLIKDIQKTKEFSIVFDEDIHISNSKYEEYIITIKKNLLDINGFDYISALNSLKIILEDESIKKIVFDEKNILHFLKEYNINIIGECFDALLADYLTKGGRKHNKNIQELCEEYNYEDNSKASCLFLSKKSLTDKIEKYDMNFLFNDIEQPLIKVLFKMEECGFKLDEKALLELNENYNRQLNDLTEEIFSLAGEKFNINSPKQLANILFEKLGLPNKHKGSTGIEVLEKLYNIHPIIEKIIRYRKIYKLNSTYVESYLEKMDKTTHLVHTLFNQTLTNTGRLSSVEPNLQNIPIRDEEGKGLRKIFISRFNHGKIISADYSQIELRLLAHFSQDEKLINSFLSGNDIHTKTASEIFNVPLEYVDSEMRRKAKAVNFGIVYGISDYGLSQSIHSTRSDAKIFIEKYFETYPKVKQYLEESIEFAKTNGFVKTLYNRRRMIDELNSNNYNLKQFGERVALNMPLQGTASDIIKLAMINVNNEIEKRNLKSKLILQIHDELIVDCDENETEIIKEILKDEMENVVKLNVPLIVNISEGDNLFGAK